MKFIRLSLIMVSFFVAFFVSSQTEADVNVASGGYGMVKTNLTLDYDRGWKNIRDGFQARFSYEFLRTSHFTLTANARYSVVDVSFDSDELTDGYDGSAIGLNGTHQMGQAGLTTMYNTTVAGKRIMAMAMLNSEWAAGGFRRFSGIVMGLLMLKADRNTQFGIGPLVMINTTSKIPAFPVFVYRHRFNPRWQINLYGAMFGVDYTPTRRDMISLGADVNVKAFYFRPSQETGTRLPDCCRFTSTSVRPMVRYRHMLGRNFYFDISSGISLKMSSRVNGVNGTKVYFKCDQKRSPFVQAAVSYSL